MGGMENKHQVRLGAVQETLFIPSPHGPARRSANTRYLLPLADPVAGKAMAITLFRASSPAADGPGSTARAGGPA